MPSLLTHYYFAEDFLFSKKGERNFLTDHKDAFRVGSQGPDPLFFMGILPKRGLHIGLAKDRLGSKIHKSDFTSLFSSMTKEIEAMNLDNEQDTFKAFILGQLAHYLLDSTAHPYVYYWTGFNKSGKLSGTYNYAHAHFEGRIDTNFATLRGNKELIVNPYKVLNVDDGSLDIIDTYFVSAMRNFFSIELPDGIYKDSLLNMVDIYKYINNGGQFRKCFWGETAIGQLYLPRTASSSCLNPDHISWKEPGSGKIRKESFDELFAKALERLDLIYSNMLAHGFNTDSIKSYLEPINYNGLTKDQKNTYKDEKKTLID